jgi:hypothetical protein
MSQAFSNWRQAEQARDLAAVLAGRTTPATGCWCAAATATPAG